MANDFHIPVLKTEALDALNIEPGKTYIDATLGGGGHTRGILERGGKVLGFDQDLEAIDYVKQQEQDEISGRNLVLVNENFAHLHLSATHLGFTEISGVLFDLGVSTHQLETANRGFSFNQNGPLDMRKDPGSQGVTAADLIRAASESELARIIWDYGEDREARRIARAIKLAGDITTTQELATIITQARHKVPGERTHPATKTFQALRIAVNDELGTLEEGLNQALNILLPGGRLVVISFHSLEDRIVKNFFKKPELKNLTFKPVEPSQAEINHNPKSRSAKMRYGVKL